jgi:signal transduction histidine kinase
MSPSEQAVRSPEASSAESRRSSDIALRRRSLALAHAVWVISAAVALLVFLAAIPLGYALLFSGTPADPPIDAPGWYVSVLAFANGLASMLVALVSLGLAALLFWKRRDEPIALLVSFYLLAYGIVMAGPLEALNGFRPSEPASGTSQVGLIIPTDLIWQIQGALTIPAPLLFLYLFPNGRFVPRWTRWVALLLLFIAPPLTFVDWSAGVTSTDLLNVLLIAVYFGMIGAGLYAQVYRYRRSATSVERQQIKWVVWGVALTFLIMGVLYVPYVMASNLPAGAPQPAWVPMSELGWWASLSIIPLCLAVAVMRYRLWDIDVLLNRALVYGSLTAAIVGMYVLVIAALGALVHATGNLLVSLLVTAVIAVLFQPLRERLQRAVNRLMYGERDDPYAVISRLGQRLEATITSDAVLPMFVETVAQALKIPYAAIQLVEEGGPPFGDESSADPGRPSPIVASYGQPQPEVTTLPLVYQSETIGHLLLAPRAPGEAFTPADRRLLANLAQQAGAAAHTVRLTADLQHSRERLVTAREEERRRLRRDLHDGLGPALAAQTLKVGSARALYPHDPVAADALLAELERDSEAAITDIRRLVYNLRPPALDELGLVGAICEQAAQYRGSAVSIQVDAPTLPALPAAVEVAAYRIVQEALANVVRHAHARTCRVQLAIDSALSVTVTDDGQGIPPNHPLGIGLTSMRERAAELGGACVVEAGPNGGTRVTARLPLGACG